VRLRPKAARRPVTALATGKFVAWLLGQAAVLSALLFYFGFVRTRSAFSYLGVDLSLVGLTPTELILRSANSIAMPAAVIFLFWLGTAIAVEVMKVLALSRSIAAPVVVLPIAVALLLGPSVLGESVEPSAYFVFAIAGIAIAAISLAVTNSTFRALAAPISAAAILALFLAVGWQAKLIGQQSAKSFVAEIAMQPELVIRSNRSIGLVDGEGVTVRRIDPTIGYQYEVRGLRLIVKAGGNYILVRPGDPLRSTFFVPATNEVWVELSNRRTPSL